MKKVRVAFFITLCFSLNNCDSNLVGPPNFQLKNNIIGNWTDNDGYTIHFDSNESFRDTIIIINYYPELDTTTVVRTGKYQITNSILKLTSFEFEYVDLGNLDGIAMISQEYKINIYNNIMNRKVVKIYDNMANSDGEILGDWFYAGWECSYSTDTTMNDFTGIKNEQISFYEDSIKFKQKIELGSPPVYSHTLWIDFTYNKPILNIPALAYYNATVDFKSNKMIWYFDYSVKDLVRIK